MKTKYILTASTLILALASCTSEVEEAISGQKVPLQITASIERDSRAAGVEDTDFKEGESIQFAGNYEEDPYIATFTGKDWIFERSMILDNNDRTIQAMYPVGGEFLLEPGLWEQIMVRFNAGTNILLSYPDVVNNSQPIAKLRFRHLMSRVHFSVTNPEAKKLTSITLSGENIYQDAIFISDANLNYYVFDDFHTGEIIIKNENATAIEVQDFDALLVPHSQGDATLTLNYEGGKTYTTTITLPELKMGDYYRVPITINADEEESSTDTHEYVDLGLPSGTLWATCNVGANSPEEMGTCFAWGEVEPKSMYTWSTYKYYKESDDTMTKYGMNSDYGTVDNKSELDLEDDAAYMNWGEGWRMPSDAQFTELRTNCTWTWNTTKTGYDVVGPNKATFFLPAIFGYYWSRSLDTTDAFCAYIFHIDSSDVGRSRSSRYCARYVRPVRQQ